MPYFLVDNFNGGMDTRRNTAAPAGTTVRDIRNAFVNTGGEIERRRSFVMNQTVTDALQNTTGNIVLGPYPSWDRNTACFLAHATPSTSGTDWFADGTGAGVVLADGDIAYQMFSDPSIEFNRDFARIEEVSFFVEQAILTYSQDLSGGQTSYETYNLTIPNTNYGPSASARLINVNGFYPRGTAVTLSDHISRFDTLFGLGPNNFTLRKHQDSSPQTVTGTGSGQVDIRSNGARVGAPRAIHEYYNQIAIFCEYGIQFWNIDPDPSAWSYDRSISSEAIVGPRTPILFQGGDLLYLTSTGIRSLRARDSSNFALSTDVGSPIDSEVTSLLKERPIIGNIATSVVHFGLGQIWFFIKDQVFVLSSYQSEGIRAWSIYDLPAKNPSYDTGFNTGFSGFDPNAWAIDAIAVSSTICLRTFASVVYTYGDADESGGTHYADDYTTTVTTHYFGVQDPFTDKVFNSVDATASGNWTIEYSLDPGNETWVEIYSGDGLTHGLADIKIEKTAQLIALRFTTTDASAATLSQFAIHYDKTEDQG